MSIPNSHYYQKKKKKVLVHHTDEFVDSNKNGELASKFPMHHWHSALILSFLWRSTKFLYRLLLPRAQTPTPQWMELYPWFPQHCLKPTCYTMPSFFKRWKINQVYQNHSLVTFSGMNGSLVLHTYSLEHKYSRFKNILL